MSAEPIVLIGGFGSHWKDYRAAAQHLANVAQRRVFIANLTRLSWMVGGLTDYEVLLRRAAAAIQHALQVSGASRVIVVGHSAGGIIGRAYLGDRAWKPHHHAWHGYRHVSHLIMVGSPLQELSSRGYRRASRAASWVARTYPDAYYADQGVRYGVVRSRFVFGKRDGTPLERMAWVNYRFISGEGEQWGDGVVPTQMSTLRGAACVELEGVAHSPAWQPWFFGDEETIRSWWEPLMRSAEQAAAFPTAHAVAGAG